MITCFVYNLRLDETTRGRDQYVRGRDQHSFAVFLLMKEE